MIRSFRQILDLLTPRERRGMVLLGALMLIAGAMDAVGVASVFPLLAVVSDPQAITDQPWLARAYETLGFESPQRFTIFLALASFALLLTSNGLRALTIYAVARFNRMRSLNISLRLLERYLHQPYAWFQTRHTSELSKTVLQEVQEVVTGPLQSLMQIAAQSMVVLFLVALLVAIEPVAALGAAALFGLGYGIVFAVSKRKLRQVGEERVQANAERFRHLGEALGGIKTVKLMGIEDVYVRRYRAPANRLARALALIALIRSLPRQLLEVILFGGVILFVLWLLATSDGDLGGIVPTLGVYVVAAARMFPAVQQLFQSAAAFRFGQPALRHLHGEISALEAPVRRPPGPAIPIRESVALQDVSFTFPGADSPALRGVSLTIPANSTVGVVGGTGAGKSTAADLLLGLLRPQTGHLTVDGRPLGPEDMRGWQRSIGYVPQHIYLIDNSVAENIAFGVKPAEIDQAAVERAARVARLHDFVQDLPQGYATAVGELGGRLSGGQRQRIGIARALYRDPPFLVFDEATSALDNLTERAVMDAIQALGRSKTILLIAHRLSTVRQCHRIYLFERGRVAASGTYDALLEDNAAFRDLHVAAAS